MLRPSKKARDVSDRLLKGKKSPSNSTIEKISPNTLPPKQR